VKWVVLKAVQYLRNYRLLFIHFFMAILNGNFLDHLIMHFEQVFDHLASVPLVEPDNQLPERPPRLCHVSGHPLLPLRVLLFPAVYNEGKSSQTDALLENTGEDPKVEVSMQSNIQGVKVKERRHEGWREWVCARQFQDLQRLREI